jgi:hypothetical protein
VVYAIGMETARKQAKRGPKPKPPEMVRSARLIIPVTVDEHSAVVEMASESGTSIAEYVRAMIGLETTPAQHD